MSVSELQVLENTSVSSGFWPKLRSSFAAHGIFIVLMLAYLVAFQASKFFYPDVVDKHPLQVVFGWSPIRCR